MSNKNLKDSSIYYPRAKAIRGQSQATLIKEVFGYLRFKRFIQIPKYINENKPYTIQGLSYGSSDCSTFQ